jgi:DNA-binding response OmpR family regulator
MKKILIVEDDVFLREMYVHSFEKEGFKMVEATDGEEGIAVAENASFDLILLDIMMPKKSGLEVLQSLRLASAKSAKTPIILLSNLGQESVIREAFKMGADGFILKSDLLPRDVVNRVTDFLNGKLTKEDFLATKSLD